MPYSRGRDFEPGSEVDDADDSAIALDDGVRSSLFVNLLTEDNLPYYFRDIDGLFGRDERWGDWARRWTAEEGRHSIVIRDYLTVTPGHRSGRARAGPHGAGEQGEVPARTPRARASSISRCRSSPTRIAHRNTGKVLDDPVGYES